MEIKVNCPILKSRRYTRDPMPVLALFIEEMYKVPKFLHKKNPKCLADI